MSDFFRKAHLKVKGSNGDLASFASAESSPTQGRPSRPPTSRSASAASSIHTINSDSDGHATPKRKQSLAKKGKKRLASLFSSSSLDVEAGDSEKHKHHHTPSTPKHSHTTSHATHHRPSPLHPTASSSSTATYTRLGMKRTPSTDGLAKDVQRLSIITTPVGNGVSASPESASPAVGAPTLLDTPARERAESLFSRYDLEDLSSDEENDAFFTPTDGLSEIGEGDEEDQAVAATSQPVTASPTTMLAARSEVNDPKANPKNVEPIDAHNVPKGALSTGADVLGTGPSTLRRSQANVTEVTVKPREAHKDKVDPHSVDQAAMLGADVDTTRELLQLFLRSKMREAEDVCLDRDPDGVHLYLQVAYCIFQAIKGMMTFDANDLSNALEISKNVQIMATSLRKPSEGLMSRFGSIVKPGAGVQRLKGMTVMERHAELVYAESSLFKALLAIVAGGDWFGMIREALSMRAAWGIYRTMQTFIEESDAKGYDDDIDMDFRSGVALGAGTSSLMLSLLPGKVLKIAEVFGYGGDREVALKVLYSAGGWTHDSDVPIHDEHNEGLRRPVVDLILLVFHLVLALLMPISGVDIPMARKILMYNMRIYPDGIFFLYFQARLFTAECNPDRANDSLQQAMDLKLEYVQLQHMCLWDYANNYTMLGDWKGALDCFNVLREESNWSRAVYTYSTAACIVELVADGHPGASLVEAEKLMKEVPKLCKKLAGKSLPIEKLVSRKTRKFQHQSHRLFLPGIELAYVFGSLGHAPRRSLISTLIPRIDRRLAELEASTPEEYGRGYWDDLVLGHFLRGVCKAMARYQPPHADKLAREIKPTDPSNEELDEGAEKDLLAAIRHAPEVELDHYIVYHTHFELGKLYSQRGEAKSANKHFEIVMSGKLPELNKHEQKAQGKYSLEGALLIKTHSAIQALKEGNVAA